MRAAAFLTAMLLLSGCVKDNLAYCPGRLTVIPDWSLRTDGVSVPSAWMASVGDRTIYGGAEEFLFAPGTYPVHVYNPADNITICGTTVSAAASSGPAGQAGTFVHNTPGWFFTCSTGVEIERNGRHCLTALMRQQVRQLTIVIDPAEGTPEIGSIAGTLSGVAGTFDMDSERRGSPSDIALVFTKIVSGPDAGKWAATVRLLGVTGAVQYFQTEVVFVDRAYGMTTLRNDMAAALSDFNVEMTEPLTLALNMTAVPCGAGFTAMIDAWTALDRGMLTAQ